MYLEMAVEDDKEMIEAWKADASIVLFFVSICLLCCASINFMSHRLVILCVTGVLLY